METAVIIGANRGIGLGFTRQYLEAGYNVIATYRCISSLKAETNISENEKESLNHLKRVYKDNLTLSELETTDEKAVDKFVESVAKIDLLILNAGIKGYPVPGSRPQDHSSEHLVEALRVNTQAPDQMIRSFFPKISRQANACIVYMSSLVGRTADNTGGGYHPYRASKAATNSLIWNWNIELMKQWKQNNPHEFSQMPCAFAICPGWVRTDMGGANARQNIKESVSDMIKVIDYVRKTKESNGLYMYSGKLAEKYPVPELLNEVLTPKKISKNSFETGIGLVKTRVKQLFRSFFPMISPGK